MKNLIFVALFLTACAVAKPKYTTAPILFVGTYTQKLGHVNGQARGIYTCRLNPTTGALSILDSTAGIINPSFVCVSPNRHYLYSVAETGGSTVAREGKLVAYRIMAPQSGSAYPKLQKLNEVSSYGAAPCHIATDRMGKFVFVANYSTGNILSYRIQADGSLSDSICMVQHKSEKQAWAHQVFPTADNRFIIGVDKGADKIFIYRLEKTGKLSPHQEVATRAGVGPRHFAFHPNQSFGFVVNENGNTVNTYTYDAAKGLLTPVQEISTLPKDYTAQNTTAEIAVHPSGQFVYASNRGHNSIVAYRFDGKQLSLIGHYATEGSIPRHFTISPDGQLLLAANQNSSSVVSFHIDLKTGELKPTGSKTTIPTPVCLTYW
jgi:6-phosphogluconolactonase